MLRILYRPTYYRESYIPTECSGTEAELAIVETNPNIHNILTAIVITCTSGGSAIFLGERCRQSGPRGPVAPPTPHFTATKSSLRTSRQSCNSVDRSSGVDGTTSLPSLPIVGNRTAAYAPSTLSTLPNGTLLTSSRNTTSFSGHSSSSRFEPSFEEPSSPRTVTRLARSRKNN